jgi:hypothetical protein
MHCCSSSRCIGKTLPALHYYAILKEGVLKNCDGFAVFNNTKNYQIQDK